VTIIDGDVENNLKMEPKHHKGYKRQHMENGMQKYSYHALCSYTCLKDHSLINHTKKSLRQVWKYVVIYVYALTPIVSMRLSILLAYIASKKTWVIVDTAYDDGDKTYEFPIIIFTFQLICQFMVKYINSLTFWNTIWDHFFFQ
jgi:hypothetical protein